MAWVHLDVELVVKETDDAFLLRLEDGEEVWMPKSQVDQPELFEQGDENCTISVTEWIAEQKDLA